MRIAVRQLAWLLVLLAVAPAWSTEPVHLQDGGYRFDGELYQATVDPRGRLATLQVGGQDILLPPSTNAKVYGASLVAGPDHRTPQDLPRMTIEAGMVVARGDGREVGYRFRSDGIDFLFDLPDQVHWVLHLNRDAITHLARPDGQVAPLADGGPMAAARALEKAAIRVDPPVFVHIPWLGSPGAADMVVAGYCNVGPGKAEAHLNVSRHSGWVHQIQVVSIKPSCPDHLFPRETAEFRQVYADHARCVDVLFARDKVDPQRIVAVGASRTGPPALAAAALDQRIALVDIHVPTSAGISWPTRFYGGWGAHGSSAKPADVPLEKWLRLLAYFDMVNFAPDVKCPVILGLGLRDYGLSPAPGIIAAYAYLPGDKALGVSPWEGHCYPEAFRRLQASYRQKYLAGQHQ